MTPTFYEKIVNKKWGSKYSFWHHSADKYSYVEPFGENQAQPKTERKHCPY